MTQASQAMIQALTFCIAKEEFAVPVALVREILDYREPFRIPRGPVHFVGLIDVRGQSIPIIDLRLRLGLPAAEPTPFTRILILEVPDGERMMVVGVMIDRALSVCVFAPDAVDASPEIGVSWPSDYIEGVVRQEGSFVVLIDIGRILTRGDVALIDGSISAAA